MTTFNVSNVSQLENALASAHGGDTIDLAAGSYSGLGTLSGLNYSSNVTITSADASNPAVITPFYLSNSSNLTFSHITFNAAGSTDPYANRVISSTGISFDHDTFQGDLTGAVSSEQMDGLGFFSSSNVSVTNSDFNHLADGIANSDTNGGVFSDNSFHEIRTDGIDNSSSANLQILNNVFTDFSPASGDHPDAIQVWGATSDPSHDITISGNLYIRGAGSPIQGVFSNDSPGEVSNLTITHNTIIGGLYNGIAVMGDSNVTVQDNTVEAYSAAEDSWIRLQNDSGLNETGNTSYEYQVGNNTGVTQSGNTTLSALSSSDGGSALASQWVADHAGWTGTLPASVAAIAGTPSGGGSSGGGSPPSSPPSSGGGSVGAGVAHDFLGDSHAQLLMENADNGDVFVGEAAASGQLAYTQVAQLGAEWKFAGDGDFLGQGHDGFLILNSDNGALDVGSVANGQIAYTQVGQLGSEWSAQGTGTYLGDGTHDVLLLNANNGDVDVGSVVNGQAHYTQVAQLGAEWKFAGGGDFLGQGHDQFMMVNANNGDVDVGSVVNGQAQYTQVAQIGAEWKMQAAGDYMGDGKSQFLMENSNNGDVVVGEVGANGQTTYTHVAQLGSEWKVVGAADMLGQSHDQIILENSSNGDVEAASVVNGQLQYTHVGTLGAEWSFHM